MIRPLIASGSILALTVLLAARPVGARDEEGPSIKQVMVKLHKGANSPMAKLKKGLASDAPDWDSIQNVTKDFVILGASLAKNEPPKGDQESWKALSAAYFADAKSLDDAAQAKDGKAAQAAFKKLGGSCKTCHAAHKGK